MKVAIASDHAGWELKTAVIGYLEKAGHQVLDCGPQSAERVDYPDFGVRVATAVANGEAARGIAICGTGLGMSIAANKVPGIRAAVCNEIYTAKMSRKHNDANVLTLGARVIGAEVALEIVTVWLAAEFDGGTHQQRVLKLNELDRRRTVIEAS